MRMIKDLKQYVPSEVCLSCDGCCRFKEEESPWRPKVAAEEIELTAKTTGQSLPSKRIPKDTITPSGHIKAISCGQGNHICTFFNPESNTCKIYNFRPFECRLYPFVLTKNNTKVELVVHHACPYVQKTRNQDDFGRYVNYLKEYFKRKEIVDFIGKNPQLLGDYSGYRNELESLFAVT